MSGGGRTKFVADFDNAGGAALRLVQTSKGKFFGPEQTENLLFDNWHSAAPESALPALSALQQVWADEVVDSGGKALVEPDGSIARLRPSFIAQLSNADAVALGLPRGAPLSLSLSSRGSLTDSGFRVEARWVRQNGAPVFATRKGARVDFEGRPWRVVDPLHSLLDAVEELNAAATEPDRFARFAELKALLPDDIDTLVLSDGYIDALRISYAGAFSLSFDAQDKGFTFDPVLFSRKLAGTANELGQVLDETADSLLPARLQAVFAQRFRQSDGSRRAYLIGEGGIVYLDPALRPVLELVRRAQGSDAATRKAFAANPRRFIREILGPASDTDESGENSAAANALDELFVETQQFSARVKGIDVWQKPVLPWILPQANSWLPEKFGIRVGEEGDATLFEVAPDQVHAALEAITAAIEAGAETVEILTTTGPETVPASQATREALEAIAELASGPKSTAPNIDGEPQVDEPTDRYFLQVSDNLETVAFAPLAPKGREATATPQDLPTTLQTVLKPHQEVGFQWLAASWRGRAPGVLLADDMGLGKTLQALTFLAWLREQPGNRRPALIVAPTGLLANWAQEIELHVKPGALGPLVRAYGSGLARMRAAPGRDIDSGSTRLDASGWESCGVVLTTYETLRDYHFSFARTPFSTVIYDEAQKLKNPAAQVTVAAKTLNARLQIAMTGTPVENRLQDLWSILDVVHPSLLGSSREFEQSHQPNDLPQLQSLNDRLRKPVDGRPPVMLRRMKADHLPGLPAKSEQTLPQDMPPTQARAYSAAVQRAIAGRGEGAERGRMLEVLQRLRSVSLHPYAPAPGEDADAYIADSARLKATFQKLDEIAALGQKALIFCESLQMQAFLATSLQRRFGLRWRPACINGSMPGDRRQEAVRTFQERGPGFDVMVLSPKAGGVGLTITAANHVIHLSRWWNPAVEDQSTDRAYRIGQKQDVTVYLPLAEHPDADLRDSSFDLRLNALLERKRRLSRDLLVPPETADDLSGLFDEVSGGPSRGHDEGTGSAGETAADQPTDDAEQFRHSADAEPEPEVEPEPDPPPATVSEFEVQERFTPWVSSAPRRMAFRAGQRRDFSIFEEPLGGQIVTILAIDDPYASASPQNRRAVVDFVKHLSAWAKIQQVRVTCWDADSIDGWGRETNKQQHDDFQKAWKSAFGEVTPLQVRPKSRRSGYDFHDRRVQVRTASGQAILWDLSGGIDRLMRVDKECVVYLEVEHRH